MAGGLMEISDRLLAEVATDATQPGWFLGEISSQRGHHLRGDLDAAVASVSSELVDEYFAAPSRKWIRPNDEYQARIDVVVVEVTRRLYEMRMRALCGLDARGALRPYGHEALAGLQPDEDGLISAGALMPVDGCWTRSGFTFHLPPSLQQANSTYWTTQHLLRLDPDAELSIRLDPLLVCTSDQHRTATYLMVVYGQPLDWDRLAKLKSEEHARWQPDDQRSAGGMLLTDMSWTPKGDGVHFKCEELPLDATQRPARYVHAVYDPASEAFTHFDGAVRYYTPEQLDVRRGSHVRKAGKQGIRVKYFRTDGVLDRDTWCDVVASFFVWNQDMRAYFLGARQLESREEE